MNEDQCSSESDELTGYHVVNCCLRNQNNHKSANIFNKCNIVGSFVRSSKEVAKQSNGSISSPANQHIVPFISELHYMEDSSVLH